MTDDRKPLTPLHIFARVCLFAGVAWAIYNYATGYYGPDFLVGLLMGLVCCDFMHSERRR